MIRMNRQKVATKFNWLLTLAVAIPVLAISTIITGYLLHGYVEDVHEKDALHLKGLVHGVQWFLDHAFSVNHLLSINPEIIDQTASAEKDWDLRVRRYNEKYDDGPLGANTGLPLLVRMQKEYDFLDLLFVQDASGNQTSRSFGALGKRGERWWFKRLMSDDKPRKSHILARGEYLKPGKEVSFNTPAFLPPLPKGAPKNRLGLAQWLVAPENPLVARVQMNRVWQYFLGASIVNSPSKAKR